ncbi:MAG TPA: tetratricopeptide repeat protein [Pseudomonadales bacterium]|nr:tetratricopeptide repeat protein [Pseudomonadales bacterium]
MYTLYNPGIFDGIAPEKYPQLKPVIDWLETQAQKGNVQAQANLGTAFALGIGVPLNREKAIEWLQKAAAENHPLACFNLGAACEDPFCHAMRFDQARQFYEGAQKTGFLPAVLRLAERDIDSIDSNTRKKAYKIFKKLADLGNSPAFRIQREALFWQGACQMFSRGTSRRWKAGEEAIERAALLGFKPAQYFLYDYHALHHPSFPVDSTWGITGVATMMPLQPKLSVMYAWFHLLPERRQYQDEYTVRNLSHYDVSYGKRLLDEVQENLQQVEILMNALRREETRWARKSGLHDLLPEAETDNTQTTDDTQTGETKP